jgi:hypothetical protein
MEFGDHQTFPNQLYPTFLIINSSVSYSPFKVIPGERHKASLLGKYGYYFKSTIFLVAEN